MATVYITNYIIARYKDYIVWSDKRKTLIVIMLGYAPVAKDDSYVIYTPRTQDSLDFWLNKRLKSQHEPIHISEFRFDFLLDLALQDGLNLVDKSEIDRILES